MARGGFGSPTIFIDKTDMYFGNDRHAADPRGAAAAQSERGLMPKAVVCRELGPPESLRLETLCLRAAGAGQVRVAIHAAGINFPDILMAAGEYQLKPQLPFTPGVEAAGEVIEVDGAAGVAVGDRVIVKMRHGAYADEAVVTPSQLMPLPSTFDYAEGATFLAAHGTAYHALIDRGQLQAGRSAAGAWRRRRRRACRGRDRQAARRDRDRGGVIGGKARGGARRKAPIISCSTRASRSATPSSASPTAAAPTWCSIPSAARFSRTACAASPGARGMLVIGFTGGIGLARTNLLLIKGASVLGVRAGEAVRKNPALGEARHQGADGMGGSRKGPAEHLAPPAAGRLRAGDAAVDRPQGDRAGGADDAVSSVIPAKARASIARAIEVDRPTPAMTGCLLRGVHDALAG